SWYSCLRRSSVATLPFPPIWPSPSTTSANFLLSRLPLEIHRGRSTTRRLGQVDVGQLSTATVRASSRTNCRFSGVYPHLRTRARQRESVLSPWFRAAYVVTRP